MSILRLTAKLAEAGRLLEIPVQDHLIIAKKNYFSFADQGLMYVFFCSHHLPYVPLPP